MSAYYDDPAYVPSVRCLPPCGAIDGPHLLDECYQASGGPDLSGEVGSDD